MLVWLPGVVVIPKVLAIGKILKYFVCREGYLRVF